MSDLPERRPGGGVAAYSLPLYQRVASVAAGSAAGAALGTAAGNALLQRQNYQYQVGLIDHQHQRNVELEQLRIRNATTTQTMPPPSNNTNP
jgi:hypothetical protein